MKFRNKAKTGLQITLIISAIFIISCGEQKNSEADLVYKNNRYYKKGSDTPFTGRERALVEDKTLEFEIKNGIKHGEFLIYSEDGILEIKGQLDSNINVGKWQYFYPSGELESEGNFVDNQPEGKWFWYYRDGRKREEGNYSAGNRVGMWYQYNDSGDVVFEKNFDLEDTLKTQADSSNNKF